MKKDMTKPQKADSKESQEAAEKHQLLLDEIADKWTILILSNICSQGGNRFNQLKREINGISQKTLTQCLRKLERSGLVNRRVIAAKPLGVEYTITELGATLHEPLDAMAAWVDNYLEKVTQAQKTFDRELSE